MNEFRNDDWLDRQLRAVNDDERGAMVTLFQSFPAWSGGADGPDPVTGTKPPEQRIPIDPSWSALAVRIPSSTERWPSRSTSKSCQNGASPDSGR